MAVTNEKYVWSHAQNMEAQWKKFMKKPRRKLYCILSADKADSGGFSERSQTGNHAVDDWDGIVSIRDYFIVKQLETPQRSHQNNRKPTVGTTMNKTIY